MKQILLVMAWLMCATAPAFAWGAPGHRLILDLAYERLTAKARAEFDRLLAAGPAHPLAECPLATRDQVATWPDCARFQDQFRKTYDEHFDDIPLFAQVPKRLYCKDDLCATSAIRRNRRVLANRHASDGARLEALSFLVHYIGDIHQPLHAADNKDKGGNDVKVIYLGEARYRGRDGAPAQFNLHGVWDTPIANAAIEGDGRAAVVALVNVNQRRWAGFAPDRWAQESHRVAVQAVYGALPVEMAPNASPETPVIIDQAYVNHAIPVVRAQIARATVRLADALNTTLR